MRSHQGSYYQLRKTLGAKSSLIHSFILKGYEYKSSKLCIAIDAANVLEAGIQVRIPVQVIC